MASRAQLCQPMSVKVELLSLLALGLVAFSCTPEDEPAPVWNVDTASASGAYHAVFSPDPNPPIVGDNTLLVEFTDPSMVSDVTVGAWMPAHGHGTPEDPVVTETVDGDYEVSKLNYIMPGGWELTVDVDGSAGPDQFVIAFDVR